MLSLFNGDNTIALPCIHIFHTECIKNWLKIDENILIINKTAKYGGYYLYDE